MFRQIIRIVVHHLHLYPSIENLNLLSNSDTEVTTIANVEPALEPFYQSSPAAVCSPSILSPHQSLLCRLQTGIIPQSPKPSSFDALSPLDTFPSTQLVSVISPVVSTSSLHIPSPLPATQSNRAREVFVARKKVVRMEGIAPD
ncbi:unnamed protein product [Euphydryas editha]|uniref:Uncharacterized protein n=1 Tax=Euphydryas editha TaxID=104508 RepID=A0AAU9UQ75_EUPED|nr:unnamed protein product [Euphydryas editha]